MCAGADDLGVAVDVGGLGVDQRDVELDRGHGEQRLAADGIVELDERRVELR